MRRRSAQAALAHGLEERTSGAPTGSLPTSGSEAPASLLSEDDVVLEASSERAGT
jgi:hypothetical protein